MGEVLADVQEVVHFLGLVGFSLGLDGAVRRVKLFPGAVGDAHAGDRSGRVETARLDLPQDQLAVLDLVELGLLGLLCARRQVRIRCLRLLLLLSVGVDVWLDKFGGSYGFLERRILFFYCFGEVLVLRWFFLFGCGFGISDDYPGG